MMREFLTLIGHFIHLCNKNAGFISVILFGITISLGVVTGIFKSLIKKPNLLIELYDFPSFCSIFPKEKKHGDDNIDCTAIVLHLNIKNVGNIPTDIDNIEVGVHNHSWKYFFRWFWIARTKLLGDFGVDLEDGKNIYPFLISTNLSMDTKTYLREGEIIGGIVYFEADTYGDKYLPKAKDGYIKIKVKVEDTYKTKYQEVFEIPLKDIKEARRDNQFFGKSLENQRKYYEALEESKVE